VIIDYFHVISISVSPFETDTILVVDSNAVLPGTIAGEFFQPISGRDCQVIQGESSIQDCQFFEGWPSKTGRNSEAFAGLPELFCIRVQEADNHFFDGIVFR
jgi:hypothetical protein